jgi:hypothetical protein
MNWSTAYTFALKTLRTSALASLPCIAFRDAVNARPCAGFSERPQLLGQYGPDQEGMPPSPTDQQPDRSEPVVGKHSPLCLRPAVSSPLSGCCVAVVREQAERALGESPDAVRRGVHQNTATTTRCGASTAWMGTRGVGGYVPATAPPSTA